MTINYYDIMWLKIAIVVDSLTLLIFEWVNNVLDL